MIHFLTIHERDWTYQMFYRPKEKSVSVVSSRRIKFAPKPTTVFIPEDEFWNNVLPMVVMQLTAQLL